MYYFLLGLLILDCLVLAAAILLQSGKGGGVAAMAIGTAQRDARARVHGQRVGRRVAAHATRAFELRLGLRLLLRRGRRIGIRSRSGEEASD